MKYAKSLTSISKHYEGHKNFILYDYIKISLKKKPKQISDSKI